MEHIHISHTDTEWIDKRNCIDVGLRKEKIFKLPFISSLAAPLVHTQPLLTVSESKFEGI